MCLSNQKNRPINSFVVHWYFKPNQNGKKHHSKYHSKLLSVVTRTKSDTLDTFLKIPIDLSIARNITQRGLVVKADGSRSRGCGFEPWHHILDGFK
jgi:hypothetical protein